MLEPRSPQPAYLTGWRCVGDHRETVFTKTRCSHTPELIRYLVRDKLQRAIDAVIHVGEDVVDRLHLLQPA